MSLTLNKSKENVVLLFVGFIEITRETKIADSANRRSRILILSITSHAQHL